jgi:branched-chain amino acid transport system substrate-binding protein
MKQHGDMVAGKKIEIIYKDTTGPAPEIAKRADQDLVIRDKVDFLSGFGLTPEALAVAPVATEAKKPMIIMNAATSIITTKSPYIARVSVTLPQLTAPLATWAAKNGIKQVYTLVSDYGPGIDAEETFRKTFTAAGGSIVDSVRVPIQIPISRRSCGGSSRPNRKQPSYSCPRAAGIAFMKTFRARSRRRHQG